VYITFYVIKATHRDNRKTKIDAYADDMVMVFHKNSRVVRTFQ
jgi:hypothetical protein